VPLNLPYEDCIVNVHRTCAVSTSGTESFAA